ncbi:hypothetical protein [Planococcus sp. 4-30]|uniref:hypothetical protein n=1 Tax=Planococcus sp. 4-30 TaxID=2874583 RepID=UPI001CBD8B09|nr:hypothetical protein [Planococcus sp. 4-30]
MKFEERNEFAKKIAEIDADRKRLIALVTEPIRVPAPKIEISSFNLPSIDFSVFQPPIIDYPRLAAQLNQITTFKIPDISFPKIEIPEIDYERIEEITNDNSKFGWTLTGEMSLGDYLEDDMIGTSQKEKDDYFYEYYSKNDWKNFGYTKNQIIENIEPRWHDLIQDCFDSFEDDKYKLVIPTLFTIIEGEMSFVFDSPLGSGPIIKMMVTQAENEESKLKQISLYSVVHSMTDGLFGSLSFAKDRNDLVNRHRVLHGRDEPKHWQKVDALRLFNVISSLQFIKDLLNENKE